MEHRSCLGHCSPSSVGTKGPAGSIQCGGEEADWRDSRERDCSLSFGECEVVCRERAGQHSRGAVGSPLLAWGQAALCWVNLQVLIWSVQMFLPALAACYLVFSAGFSGWALCPSSAVAHSLAAFTCNPAGPPGWGACRQGCSSVLLCLPGSLGRWAAVSLLGLCNLCNLKAKNGHDFSMKWVSIDCVRSQATPQSVLSEVECGGLSPSPGEQFGPCGCSESLGGSWQSRPCRMGQYGWLAVVMPVCWALPHGAAAPAVSWGVLSHGPQL